MLDGRHEHALQTVEEKMRFRRASSSAEDSDEAGYEHGNYGKTSQDENDSKESALARWCVERVPQPGSCELLPKIEAVPPTVNFVPFRSQA
jgi:hypothetical protein